MHWEQDMIRRPFRIYIHREIMYDPDTRLETQTGKCQTDGRRVGTYSIGCTQIFSDLARESRLATGPGVADNRCI